MSALIRREYVLIPKNMLLVLFNGFDDDDDVVDDDESKYSLFTNSSIVLYR